MRGVGVSLIAAAVAALCMAGAASAKAPTVAQMRHVLMNPSSMPFGYWSLERDQVVRDRAGSCGAPWHLEREITAESGPMSPATIVEDVFAFDRNLSPAKRSKVVQCVSETDNTEQGDPINLTSRYGVLAWGNDLDDGSDPSYDSVGFAAKGYVVGIVEKSDYPAFADAVNLGRYAAQVVLMKG